MLKNLFAGLHTFSVSRNRHETNYLNRRNRFVRLAQTSRNFCWLMIRCNGAPKSAPVATNRGTINAPSTRIPEFALRSGVRSACDRHVGIFSPGRGGPAGTALPVLPA